MSSVPPNAHDYTKTQNSPFTCIASKNAFYGSYLKFVPPLRCIAVWNYEWKRGRGILFFLSKGEKKRLRFYANVGAALLCAAQKFLRVYCHFSASTSARPALNVYAASSLSDRPRSGRVSDIARTLGIVVVANVLDGVVFYSLWAQVLRDSFLSDGCYIDGHWRWWKFMRLWWDLIL